MDISMILKKYRSCIHPYARSKNCKQKASTLSKSMFSKKLKISSSNYSHSHRCAQSSWSSMITINLLKAKTSTLLVIISKTMLTMKVYYLKSLFHTHLTKLLNAIATLSIISVMALLQHALQHSQQVVFMELSTTKHYLTWTWTHGTKPCLIWLMSKACIQTHLS